jgi:hypothetical protein
MIPIGVFRVGESQVFIRGFHDRNTQLHDITRLIRCDSDLSFSRILFARQTLYVFDDLL